MEHVILACISADATLSSSLVFKGGNALRIVYQGPRSTIDLDFSVADIPLADEASEIRRIIDKALQWAARRYNVKAKCQRVKRNPKSREATRPTYQIKVGYQFPSDRYYADFENRTVPNVIPVEVSLNDLVCEDTSVKLEGPNEFGVRVCSLEDIVAEKLRSLLQQPIRNRHRYQDVFDLANIIRVHRGKLDISKVTDFFRRKCSIRDVVPEKGEFNDTVRDMAILDYDLRLRDQAPDDFIPFDEAWNEVLKLVERLEL